MAERNSDMISELQKKIIQEMHVQTEIDPKVEIRKSVDFLKEYVRKHTFIKSLVLGISGGQDSTLAGKLAQMAAEELREDTGIEEYRFIALRLPYGDQVDADDAERVIDWIQPDESDVINIKPSVDANVKSLKQSGIPLSDFNEGNVKARMRMIVQYAVAGENNGVVLGTDHPAENVTGFFTKHGDNGVDLVPLFRLNKRQGKMLLRELGAPTDLIEKVPMADLEDDKQGQPDEEVLGVTYDDIDDYLEGKDVSDKARDIIESWYKRTEHKRRLPVTIFDDFWRS